MLYLIILGFNLIYLNVNAASYIMGTSGTQSTTIYDDGGSGSNYSDNIADVRYTFNCEAGKHIRIRFNSQPY